MPILWVFETDVFLCSERLVCYIKRRKPFFLDLFSRSMTWEYRGLPEVTGGYKRLQGVKGGDKGLQGVTRDYRNFFFKQKTAYEIGVRLVGSEMCIRDRVTRGYTGLQGVTTGYKK